jgi:uncharacterized membrane protein
VIQFLLFLHILLFLFSFAFTAGLGILAQRIAARGDARLIHAVFSTARPLSVAGGYGWLLTALAGGALAVNMGYSLIAPWLLVSYAVFLVLMLVGFGIHSPWQAKVIAAATTGGPELDALIRSRSHRIANIISAVCVLTLLYLMTARPG